MQLFPYVNDTLYADSVIAESVELTQDMSDRISTLSLTIKQENGPTVARYDEALYDFSFYSIDVRELYDIRLEDSTGKRYFGGQIVRIEFDRQSEDLTLLHCDCLDYTSQMDRAMVVSAQFTGQTDRAIIQSLMATYAPGITALTANIASTTTLAYFDVKERTVREALEDLAELTGAEWRVDYSKNLLYFLPTAYPAQFGLSSDPNAITGAITWNQATQTWDTTGSATWDDPGSLLLSPTYGIDAFTNYTRDFIRPINSCTVLGGFLPGGTEIKVTYEDPVSILEYGRHSHTIVDRDIAVAAVAMMRAQATVNERAYPEVSFRLSTFHDGLNVGQSLPVLHSDFQVNGAYIIRSMRMKQRSATITQYELALGAKPPDQLRLLRQIEARSRRSTQTPIALPAAGSVDDGSIGSSGISVSHLVGTISATGNVAINANALFGTVTAGQNVSINAAVIAGTISGDNVIVDAGTIQGVITGVDVAVDVTTFQGVIVSSQVADGLIDRLSLMASSLRPIPSLAFAPTLPDVNYPTGSFYYHYPLAEFRRNDAGAWTAVTESTAVSGKLEYFHIGTIKANNIVGLIVAGQIESILTGQLIGMISAAQIASVNASAITGSIVATQISTVNATAIQGSITSGQIASVAAITITGTLTAGQIASVAATTITGTLNAGQIASVNASSISGTISSTQIGSINAATITIGLVQDSQIGTVSAGKITAGTITASVSMTAPNLTITTGSIVVRINSSDFIKVTDSGLNMFASIRGSQFRMENLSNSSVFSQITLGAYQTADASGNRCDLTSTSLSFNFVNVVKARYPVRPVDLADCVNLFVYHGLCA